MGKEITNLKPEMLWKWFYALTQIPRPSNHEEKIQQFVFEFGKELGLETTKDKAGNIIIRKPATKGLEDRTGVILQAHLDMVPQKNSDKVHDFENDPIETLIDDDWVKANGTTLGADNGIGAAAAMAVLASNNIEHGPLEALFTSTEETGMDGATGLQPGVLNGRILMNTDSEDEGELYVGCAGGEDMNVQFHYSEEKMPQNSVAYLLEIKGLKGGHSGMDINLGRGNANKIFFRLLEEASGKCVARLSEINGGGLRNAIPREAFGVITVPEEKALDFEQLIRRVSSIIKAEYSVTEPGLVIEIKKDKLPATVIDSETQGKLIAAVIACPNGTIRMSDTMPGLVETSTNMAMVKSVSETKTIELKFLLRSSVDSAKEWLGRRMKHLFLLAGAQVEFSGAYPGWKPNPDSAILKVMLDVYEKKYGQKAEIKGIHAGLECGILGGIYPEWDMISFGPTIRFPHSPDEKVNIASVQKFWDFLVETLRSIQ